MHRETDSIRRSLWTNGKLNRRVIAKDARITAEIFGLGENAAKADFFMVEQAAVEGKHSFADSCRWS